MVLDGEERAGYVYQSLSFSPDSKHIASIVKRGDKEAALIDGTLGKEYDRIEEPGIRFSDDGKHSAFVAELDGEKLVVHDGVDGKHYKHLGKNGAGFHPGQRARDLLRPARRQEGDARGGRRRGVRSH